MSEPTTSEALRRAFAEWWSTEDLCRLIRLALEERPDEGTPYYNRALDAIATLETRSSELGTCAVSGHPHYRHHECFEWRPERAPVLAVDKAPQVPTSRSTPDAARTPP